MFTPAIDRFLVILGFLVWNVVVVCALFLIIETVKEMWQARRIFRRKS